MATTTILTNKGSSIINKASKDGAKCVISRVVTSTHYENLPTDLAAKAPHWWDGAEGTVTGLSLVNASLDVKVHWDARQDAQPVKSIGLMVKREGDEKDYLLYAESYSNTAVTLDHALDKIFSLPINAPAGTFDAIGNTMNAEVNEAIGGGGGGGDVPANMMTTNTAQTGLSGKKSWSVESYLGAGSLENPQDGDRQISWGFSIADFQDPIGIYHSEMRYSAREVDWFPEVDDHLHFAPSEVVYNGSRASWNNIINAANKNIPDTFSGWDTVKADGGTLLIFGNRIQPDLSIEHDGLVFMFDSSGYLKSVSPDTGSVVVTIGVVVKDAGNNIVENGRVSGVATGMETPLTFQSPIQLAAGYTITYQAIISHLNPTP